MLFATDWGDSLYHPCNTYDSNLKKGTVSQCGRLTLLYIY